MLTPRIKPQMWLLFIGLILTLSLASASFVPYRYFILNPTVSQGDLSVMSLVDGNTIQAGASQVTLDKFQSGTLPAIDLVQGTEVRGIGPFTLGSDINATDLPVPSRFAGTQFVIPHNRNTHTYYILSPDGDAQIDIQLAGVSYPVTAFQGQVVEFDAGGDNTIAGIITSDRPVVVAHLAHVSGRSLSDTFPVPPAAQELWGIYSTDVILGGLIDGTNVTVYDSDGGMTTTVINAGERQTLGGTGGSHGTGVALYLLADQPISAIQATDGDGSEGSVFLDHPYLGTRHGLPIDAQYLAIACPEADTTITLIDGANPPETQTCGGDGTTPGKAYFGSTANGIAINAGAQLESNRPIYLMYESAARNDESNLLGHKESHYLLNPNFSNDTAQVISLVDGNTLRIGLSELVLNQYQSATVNSSDLIQGDLIQGTGPFNLASEVNATDQPVPANFAGTQFVIPHNRNDHLYYLLSPYGDAQVTVQIGATTDTVAVPQGQVIEYAAGSDNTLAGIIRADRPILVSHLAHVNGASLSDSYPVPPAAQELWGIHSTDVLIGGLIDGTTITVYDSDGLTDTRQINAGERLTLGATGVAHGQGAAVHLVADQPISALQISDADGSEATAFLDRPYHGTRHGLPIDAQYLAIACTQPNTSITVNDGINAPETQTCNGDSLMPGKAYFGSSAKGIFINAGASIESDQPIYIIYETSARNDESNLIGAHINNIAPPPAAPQLDPVTTPTGDNPYTVTGIAAAGLEVRLYVNGLQQATTTADLIDGSFSLNATLIEGINDLHATAWDGQQESAASASQSLEYIFPGPDTPSLDSLVSPTNANPYAVTGIATAGIEVRLYVNGAQQTTTTADAIDGSFNFSAILDDGNNAIHVTAWDGFYESAPSATQTIDYQNTIPRDQTNTSISDIVVWTPGATPTPYIISGTLTVNAGATLIIQPNTTLEFASGATLTVNGLLQVRGSVGNEAVFTSASATPVAEDWQGIVVNAGGSADITAALIEYAHRGIDFNDAGGTVRNSILRYNKNGVYTLNTGATPLLEGNRIEQNTNAGVRVDYRSAPVVQNGNLITGNISGINATGNNETSGYDPAPLVTGNQIWGNLDWNYYSFNFSAKASGVLNASGNWWGTTDVAAIAASVYDYTDDPGESPVVDISGALDGPGGSPMPVTFRVGVIETDEIWNNEVYLLGDSSISTTTTVTISQGAVIRSIKGTDLIVDGVLAIEGNITEPVVFTSAEAEPNANDWGGILVNTGGTLVMNHAVVEYASRGVEVAGGHVSITSSLLHFNKHGVYLNGSDSDAILTDSQLVYNTDYGLYANGTSNDTTNPIFAIDGSDLFGNGLGQVYLTNYGTGSTLTLNATGNWWGTATPVLGQEIVQSTTVPAAGIVDFSAAASLPLQAPAVASLTVDYAYISPVNGDGLQDNATLSGSLSEVADWAIEVRDTTGAVLHAGTGTGDTFSLIWNGQNTFGEAVSDGQYDFIVHTTAGTRSGWAGRLPTTVDNTAPMADLDNALDGATFQNVLIAALVGEAWDVNFVDYNVQYGEGTTPAVWTDISGIQTTQIVNSPLTYWTLSSSDDSVIPIPNGQYTLKVTTSDKAGNVSTDTVLVTVDNLTVTQVNANSTGLSQNLNDTLDVQFTLNLPSTVTLQIYSEVDGLASDPIWEIQQTYTSSGSYTLSWDGTDALGVPAVPGGYFYVLVAEDGTRIGQYSPPPDTSQTDLVLNNTTTTTFNTFENDFWSMNVTAAAAGRMQLAITLTSTASPYNGQTIYPDGDGLAVEPGTYTLVWDGRIPDTGDIYIGTININVWFTAYPVNYVIVDNGAAKISGPEITGPAAPYVEVKADPYLIYLSYGQFTRFLYHIDQDATVTIKLLPPLINDFNSESAITVFSGFQSGGQDHEVQWTGVLADDPNEVTREISEDGVYTFAIEAVSNGVSTLHRGVLNAYQ